MSDESNAPLASLRREVAVVHDNSSFANLLDTAKFEHVWRVAKVFSSSGMVPKHFANKPEACFVAIQMALRLEVDPMMFMQNTYLSPDGKPAMQGQLAIALVNQRGPFKGPIQFTLSGEGDTRACRAWQYSRATGEICEVTVSIKHAKDEGWYQRNPKWKNIPDQMLRYRSGAWLARSYAPECLLGLPTIEEAQDMGTLVAQDDGSYALSPAPPRPTREQFMTPPPAQFYLVDFEGVEHGYPTAASTTAAFLSMIDKAGSIDVLIALVESNATLPEALIERGHQIHADEITNYLADRQEVLIPTEVKP